MAAPSSSIYRASEKADCSAPLRQGEILTDLQVFRVDVGYLGEENPRFNPVRHPYVLVLSQACDLDLDHQARFPSQQLTVSTDKLIPSVLFCEVVTASELRGQIRPDSKMWKRIQQNNDIRYQYLQKPDAACDQLGMGLDEFAIDFKRYLAVPTDEVYKRIERGELRRRCTLISPYLESVCQRFAHYLSRVGLPEPHFSEPAN